MDVLKGSLVANESFELSGIDRILREREPLLMNRFYALDDASLGKWVGVELLELWQAVLLHSNVDPDPMGRGSANSLHYVFEFAAQLEFLDEMPFMRSSGPMGPELRLKGNIEAAVKALNDGVLPSHQVNDEHTGLSVVRVADFQYWAARSRLPVIGPWRKRTPIQAPATRLLGTHRTKLLDVMEGVLQRYWRTKEQGGHYVSGDIRTVTAQADIIEWIRETHKVSKATSNAIAKILRPDELPKGRHPSK